MNALTIIGTGGPLSPCPKIREAMEGTDALVAHMRRDIRRALKERNGLTLLSTRCLKAKPVQSGIEVLTPPMPWATSMVSENLTSKNGSKKERTL
jgi:hypothetical protein